MGQAASSICSARGSAEHARGGRGQLVLVAGEPGIGKTRLAEELGPTLRPSACRFEAFEALAEDLRAAAEAQGLLLVLDDLQWADAASLALLVHLARGIGRSRLMIVATYRDTQTTGREALSSALLGARPGVEPEPDPAGGPDPGRGRAAAQPRHGHVRAAGAGRAGPPAHGNSYFVAELGQLAGGAGRALPDAVLDTLRARLAQLSGPCRQLIATAAALGKTMTRVLPSTRSVASC